MRSIHFPQANKVLKAPPSRRAEIQQQIDDLAMAGVDVRDMQAQLDAVLPPAQEVYDLPVWGGEVDGVERCISCWEPSPEERARIAAGGPVWLWVVGHTHPPLVLDATNPFEPTSPENEWPPGVSDGLSLPCHDCGSPPRFDFTVDDAFWSRWVPGPERLSVICLPCLDRRCAGSGLAGALQQVQWTGTGHTVVLGPLLRHRYEPRMKPEQRPAVAESFRELLDRFTLTPEEEDTLQWARDTSACQDDVGRLLAIIDRLTGRASPGGPQYRADGEPDER